MKTAKLSLIIAFLLITQIFQSLGNAAEVSFRGLGDLPGGGYRSYAYGVSADGSVVAGYSESASAFQEAFRWSPQGGMVSLGSAYTGAGVSSDGSIIVGGSYFGGTHRQAYRWTSGTGAVGLGFLPGTTKSDAMGISGNGSVIVGLSADTSTSYYEAIRWTSTGGMVGLGDLAGGKNDSQANAASLDGSVIVGTGSSASGYEAFRWTSQGGMVGLGDFPGGTFESYASGVSADGSVVVGYGSTDTGFRPFRWTAEDGMINLGGGGRAYAVSADGSVIVGSGAGAFYWTETGGTQNLRDMLIGMGADLTAWNGSTWTLTSATAISPDGKTIVGYGLNGSSPEAWIATIPEPATLILLGLGAVLIRKFRA